MERTMPVPARNPEVVFRPLREGGVFLHLVSGEYYSANPVGCAVWSFIDGARSVNDITAQLRRVLEDAPPDLLDFVERFLDELRARDLVAAAGGQGEVRDL